MSFALAILPLLQRRVTASKPENIGFFLLTVFRNQTILFNFDAAPP